DRRDGAALWHGPHRRGAVRGPGRARGVCRGSARAHEKPPGPAPHVEARARGQPSARVEPARGAAQLARAPGRAVRAAAALTLTSFSTHPDCPAALALAQRLADVARAITQEHFRRPIAVERKGDGTPVTVADRQIEQEMRRMIRTAFPGHAIRG